MLVALRRLHKQIVYHGDSIEAGERCAYFWGFDVDRGEACAPHGLVYILAINWNSMPPTEQEPHYNGIQGAFRVTRDARDTDATIRCGVASSSRGAGELAHSLAGGPQWVRKCRRRSKGTWQRIVKVSRPPTHRALGSS